MGKILEVKNLTVHIKTHKGVVQAVRGVDFYLNEQETLAVVGESGSGKSITMKGVMGILAKNGKVVEGSVMFQGNDLTKYSERQMQQVRGSEIAMIFQDPMTSLNPVTRVGDQIAEVILLHNKISKAEARKRAMEMLEQVGIPGARCDDYPHQFSGGMKQRVMIAIALACSPELLIADEPTTALDVTIQAQVLEMMKGLRDKYNTSMLMITHDLGIVAEICDEVSVVYAGRVIEHGTLEDIFKNTRHPYTEGLFNSLPNLENRQAELKPIKGLMPDPSNLPKGCAFCPRCEYATEICKTQKPPRTYRNDTHYVECHLYNKDNIHEGKVNIR